LGCFHIYDFELAATHRFGKIRAYLDRQGLPVGPYPMKTSIAFSGEIKDVESGPDAASEKSSLPNPNLKGRDIRDAFDIDKYQIHLVANKFQTGFDQPPLCGMYADKQLAGIQAVQTLARLNKAYPGKQY